jgi:uncharacterized membrane protein
MPNAPSTFLGQLGKTRVTERDRLTVDHNRAVRVIAEIDAATAPTPLAVIRRRLPVMPRAQSYS